MSPIWTAATVLLVLVLSVANSSDFTIAFDVEVPSSLVGTKEILDLVMRAKVVWFQPLNPERFLLVDQGYWSNHLFLLDSIKVILSNGRRNIIFKRDLVKQKVVKQIPGIMKSFVLWPVILSISSPMGNLVMLALVLNFLKIKRSSQYLMGSL